MTDGVVLVCAPFASVVRPAIGIATLCAALEAQGVPVEIHYENLRFAARVGIEIAEHIACEVPTAYLIGEWIFARAAFGVTSEDEEYLARVERYVPGGRTCLFVLRAAADILVEEAAQAIVSSGPRIVGFSTTFQQNAASLAIAARVRALRPSATICFGGANCEGPMGRALLRNYPQIDAVFSGESDATFPEFVRRAYAGEPLSFDPAVSVRGELLPVGAVATPVADLDMLAIPNFDQYFAALEAYGLAERIVPSLAIEASRGCWWGERKHCRFCGLNGSSMAYRAKSGARVLREVTELAERYGVERFMFTDNILQLKHVETVFDVLAERRAPYRFFCEIKANMSPDQMSRLAKGGVTAVQPGIESLDNETLRRMEKGVSMLHNVRLLRVCAELGMSVTWNLLVGIPDESDEAYVRIRERLPLLEHLAPPSGCSQIRIDRFSPYFERSEELGFTDVRPAWAYERVYRLPDEELRDLAYFFDGHPRNAASFAHLDALRATIEEWKTRSYASEDAPTLAVFELGPLVIVRDTRSCAERPLRVISLREADLLRSLREAVPLDQALAAFRVLYPGEEGDALFEKLVAWKYVMVDGNRALSLVTDFAERVFSGEDVTGATARVLPPEALAL
jgi:magnesium-protoporphyrin IX monomethyl ester (oxidative) cyclase